MKKTSTEILKKMDKDKERLEKLKKIRKERNQIKEKMKTKKPQKRSIEIVEYEDGTFSLIGYAYNLHLQYDEIELAFKAWLDNLLENGKVL